MVGHVYGVSFVHELPSDLGLFGLSVNDESVQSKLSENITGDSMRAYKL